VINTTALMPVFRAQVAAFQKLEIGSALVDAMATIRDLQAGGMSLRRIGATTRK
jgi:hypothetical protein